MPSSTGEGQPNRPRSNPAKAALRRTLQLARRQRSPDTSAEAARTRLALAACSGARVVAVYLSRPDEPGTRLLIDELLSKRVTVLAPVLRRTPDWARYRGADALRPGPHGIAQPAGEPLGAEALAEADWIWLPGLAGSASGHRLGTGGGWYDRALAHASPAARLGLLLFDDEVLPDVPVDPWDRFVHLLVTEVRRIDCIVE